MCNWNPALQFGNIGCVDLIQRLVRRGKSKDKRPKSHRNTKQTTGGIRREKNYTGRDYCEEKGIEIYYNSRDHRFSSSGLRNQVNKKNINKK